jgi:hypothetical protein
LTLCLYGKEVVDSNLLSREKNESIKSLTITSSSSSSSSSTTSRYGLSLSDKELSQLPKIESLLPKLKVDLTFCHFKPMKKLLQIGDNLLNDSESDDVVRRLIELSERLLHLLTHSWSCCSTTQLHSESHPLEEELLMQQILQLPLTRINCAFSSKNRSFTHSLSLSHTHMQKCCISQLE